MKKRLISTLLVLCMVLILLPTTTLAADTSGSCGENVTWSYSNGTLTIEGTGPMANYQDTQPWYDYHDDIKTVIIGEGVTSVGRRAFWDCSELISATIPSSVTGIGEQAFCRCTNLTSVNIPNGVTTIGHSAFAYCKSLPSVSIPDSVTVIEDWAFEDCNNLRNVTIPRSITSIGDWVFDGCGFTDVTIPDSVTSIGANAFSACSLTNINIPDSVTSIGDAAFSCCWDLASVTIPNGVPSIGERTFSSCWALTDINIPDSVVSIGKEAFSNCEALTDITIPKSVRSIDERAFAYCDSLTGIHVASENSAYTSVDGVLFDADLTYLLAYPAKRNATSYIIPDTVTNIGTSAFCDCSNLRSVTIPNGVTHINQFVFRKCGNLASITIPDSVTSIAPQAFDLCNNLKDVYYGGSKNQWEQIFIDIINEPLIEANIHYNSSSAPPVPAPSVVLSAQKLTVDGKNVDCEKYNINGSNYFKLRDMAQLLSGTASRFGVTFDEVTATVSITTGTTYEPIGTELAMGTDNSGTARLSGQIIMIDNIGHGELTVYNIGGSNFFRLRELGNVLGFEVDYDDASNTVIVRSVQK